MGDLNELEQIAAAIHNFKWSGDVWKYKREHDEADFNEMFQKMGKPSVIFPLVLGRSFTQDTFCVGWYTAFH